MKLTKIIDTLSDSLLNSSLVALPDTLSESQFHFPTELSFWPLELVNPKNSTKILEQAINE